VGEVPTAIPVFKLHPLDADGGQDRDPHVP
jgi:hypothetical protein